jgi:hypothetical protein
MKTSSYLILLAHIYIMCSCSTPPSSDTGLLADVTDTLNALPDSNEVRKGMALTNDRWASSTFALEIISDVGYNPRHECSIASADPLLGNLNDRNRELEQFWNCYESAWKLLNDSVGRESSTVYQPIVRELNRLAKSTATSRKLLVFSDLNENSSVFSVHTKKDFDLLKKDPNAVLEKLSQKGKLPPSLTGIEVFFVYHPKNPEDDERFSLMANLFSDALTMRGAKVTISGSLHIASNVP